MQTRTPINARMSRISGTLVLSPRESPSGRRADAGLSMSVAFFPAAYSALRLPMSTPRVLDKSAATHLSPARPVPHSAKRLPINMGR